MAKGRDWIDYVNMGANVVQATELDGINGKMRELAELSSQKEYREQQEAALAHCEDLLRDAVFFYTEQLRDLEEIASESAVATYIRASHLKQTYANMPQFKVSGFRKFEDKERLANVQRNFDRLIRETAQKLQPGEQESCDKCIAHIFDRKELLQLIQLERGRASLPERKAELQKVREQQQHNKRPLWVTVGYAAPIITILGGLLVFAMIFGETTILSRRIVLVTFIVWFPIAFIIAVKIPRSEYARRKVNLPEQAAALEREFSAMNAEINQHRSLCTKFGTANSDDYKNMLRERDELLKRMLGDFAKEFVKRG